jgi:hypothetical protein
MKDLEWDVDVDAARVEERFFTARRSIDSFGKSDPHRSLRQRNGQLLTAPGRSHCRSAPGQ